MSAVAWTMGSIRARLLLGDAADAGFVSTDGNLSPEPTQPPHERWSAPLPLPLPLPLAVGE